MDTVELQKKVDILEEKISEKQNSLIELYNLLLSKSVQDNKEIIDKPSGWKKILTEAKSAVIIGLIVLVMTGTIGSCIVSKINSIVNKVEFIDTIPKKYIKIPTFSKANEGLSEVAIKFLRILHAKKILTSKEMWAGYSYIMNTLNKLKELIEKDQKEKIEGVTK